MMICVLGVFVVRGWRSGSIGRYTVLGWGVSEGRGVWLSWEGGEGWWGFV